MCVSLERLSYTESDVFPLSHYRFSLPRIDWPTTRQCPSTRVCFLRVTASFPFPQIKRPTTQSAFFFCIYVPPFTPLPSPHNIEQWLPAVGMNRFQSWVVSSAISRFRSQFPTERLLTVNFRQPKVLVIHWFQLWFANNPQLGILMM
jgi:hypothetical protein